MEVAEVHSDEGVADLTTLIIRPDGSHGLQGRTLVRLPNFPGRLSARSALVHPPTPSPSFKGLEIGQRAEARRTFGLADLVEYVNLTGDANPVFTDADYARRLDLAGPLIPGGLLGGLFSYLLGTQLPGRGTNYLKQRLEFPAPAYPEQELIATVEIVRLRPEKQLVNLSTVCTNLAGEVVCRGEALVLVSDIGIARARRVSRSRKGVIQSRDRGIGPRNQAVSERGLLRPQAYSMIGGGTEK